ncbi:MAG: hypothetical protein ACPG8A_03355 [Psychrobium sp.]
MSFTSSLKLETKKATNRLNKIWKGSVVVAFQRVITSTPKLEGYAQGSWQTGEVADGKERISTRPIVVGKIPDAGGTFSLYSNSPYIMRLEDGYSQQAPRGMVKLIELDWNNIVRGQKLVHNK